MGACRTRRRAFAVRRCAHVQWRDAYERDPIAPRASTGRVPTEVRLSVLLSLPAPPLAAGKLASQPEPSPWSPQPAHRSQSNDIPPSSQPCVRVLESSAQRWLLIERLALPQAVIALTVEWDGV